MLKNSLNSQLWLRTWIIAYGVKDLVVEGKILQKGDSDLLLNKRITKCNIWLRKGIGGETKVELSYNPT